MIQIFKKVHNTPLKTKGFTYIETLIALTILAIIGTYLFPLFPKAIMVNQHLKKKEQLVSLAYYIKDYVNNWTEFLPSTKIVPFDFYMEGNELELSGDYRINHLQFIEPLMNNANFVISDYYKASIQFFETTSANRAIVKVNVWYDTNKDDIADSTEQQVSFATILIEKRIE